MPMVLIKQRLVFIRSSICLLDILAVLRSVPRVATEILYRSSAIRTLIMTIFNPVLKTLSVKIMSLIAS